MSQLAGLSEHLTLDNEGIWSATKGGVISYPESGHSECYAVEERSFWFRHRNRCILELITRFPPRREGVILDVGGGNGMVSLALAKAGLTVALLEPGRVGALNAKRRGVPTVICATLEAAQLPDRSVAAVGLFDVIEHVANDKQMLLQLEKLLERDGRLYITVPAHSYLWSTEDISAGHYRRHTRRSITQLVQSAGFEVEYCSYFFWTLPLPIFLLRALPYRLGVTSRRGQQLVSAEHAHGTRKGFWTRMVNSTLHPELSAIRKGNRVPIGASCLVSARLPC